MPAHYHERRLPHWQPDGAALFLTWRLHGSLPKDISFPPATETSGERFAAVDKILAKAATGSTWLKDDRIASIVFESLQYGEQHLHLYDLRAWVIMPNHVHLLIDPRSALPKITKSIKNYSALQANRIPGRTGEPFWQGESYDHWVRDRDGRERIVRYIERNPVAAGLAERPEDFRWSSASAGRRPTLQDQDNEDTPIYA